MLAQRLAIQLAVTLISLSATVQAEARGIASEQIGLFRFEMIASANSELEGVTSPKLSDDGAVSYYALHRDGATAIYISLGGDTRRVIGSGDLYGGGTIGQVGTRIDMNNHHDIAFSTNRGNSPADVFGVFTVASDGGVAKVSNNDLFTYFFSNGMSINDVGDVAYLATAPVYEDLFLKSSTQDGIIFRGDDFNSTPSVPMINNSGIVAFGGKNAGARRDAQMYVYNGGQVSEIDRTPRLLDEISRPAINDQGEVAYVRQMAQDAFELVLFAGGQAQILPVDGAITAQVVLNNAGTIGFVGRNSRGLVGVRTYLSGVATDVLGAGDSIFGKTAALVGVWDINSRGQLTLEASFEDGSNAILLATPIPEPSVLSIVIVAALGLSAFRRGGQRR